MIKAWYLIVRADGSTPRVMSNYRVPKLRGDEVAFKLKINYPDTWKQFYPLPELQMPEAPVVEVVVQ
jgi:hypothetical protein